MAADATLTPMGGRTERASVHGCEGAARAARRVASAATLWLSAASGQEPPATATAGERQPAPAPSSAAPSLAPAPEANELGQVIITAGRRPKDLQDYSGTVSAFSESFLRNIGVSDISGLSQVEPGLQISVNNAGAMVYIRGVGSDNTSELGDSAVAIHVDGVYLPRSRGLTSAFLDLERVEVHSGPQGVLRGRNAMGGTIELTSKAPVLGEFQTMAELTVGNYRHARYQGMLNVPLGDEVALRVAGMASQMDPTWVNAGPLDHLPGAQDMNELAAKAQLRFQPTVRLGVTLAADYDLQRSAGWVGAEMVGLLTNQNDSGTPLDPGDDYLDPIDPDGVDDPRRVYQRGRYPSAQTEHWGARLNVGYDAGPFRVELLASYRHLGWRLMSGSSASYVVDPAELSTVEWDAWSPAQQQENESTSVVSELRLASPDNQRLVWSFGLFGLHEAQADFQGLITGDPDGGFNELNMPSTEAWSLAAHGDATFQVTERFRVLAGVRYTRENKQRSNGLLSIGTGLPLGGESLCARTDASGECVETGLASDDIGRFGTEGFRFAGLGRDNYAVPSSTATNEERVNFFLDGVDSFGDRDQTAIALCNDPEPLILPSADPDIGSTTVNPGRLTRDANGRFRCANGIRESILSSDSRFTTTWPQNGERADGYLDFRAGVELDVTPDSMLYATLGSGHKSGGFNTSFPAPFPADAFVTPSYGPEALYAFEVGSKNMLAGRKLRLNGAAFTYRHESSQYQTIVPIDGQLPLDDGNVRLDPLTDVPYPSTRSSALVLQNAPYTATTYGLDLDAAYAFPLGFRAHLHALLMDARFPDGTQVNDVRLGLGGQPAEVDIGGYWLPRASPITLVYGVSQLILTAIGAIDWTVQGQTRATHYMSPFNGDGTRLAPRGPGWGRDPLTGEAAPIEADTNLQYATISQNLQRLDDEVPLYTVINLGAGWRRADGLLSVRGFVNNAFDIAHATNIQSLSGTNRRYYNDPRVAGVRMRLDF